MMRCMAQERDDATYSVQLLFQFLRVRRVNDGGLDQDRWGNGAVPDRFSTGCSLGRRVGFHLRDPDHLRPAADDYARRRILFTGASAVDGASGNRGECRALIGNHNAARRGCPLWVKSGHRRLLKQCPLYPQKRTFFHQLGHFAYRMSSSYGGRPASRQAFAKGSASMAGSASAVQNPRALNEGCNDKTCAVSAFASSKLPSLTRGATSKL